MTPLTTMNSGRQSQNCWQTALDSLDSQLKARLVAAQGDNLDILALVLKEAEIKKKLCLEKQWRFKLNGRVIILRDLFDKIIGWIHHFSAVVDVAVQFDPSVASLPWAGVRFLLQVLRSLQQ